MGRKRRPEIFVEELLAPWYRRPVVGTKLRSALRWHNIATLDQLLAMSAREFMGLPNVGGRTLDLLVEALTELGYELKGYVPPRTHHGLWVNFDY